MASVNDTAIKSLSFPHEEYVLALPGWYPTWLDPFPGDFNQRTIKAASAFTPQIVLYIGKDQTGTLNKTEVMVNRLTNAMAEICVVYPQRRVKIVDVVASNVSFLFLLLKYGSLLKKTFGKPRIIHSYIVMRGGLGGLILSKLWQVPMILTEHWTIYFKDDPGYLPTRNKVFQWLVKLVFKNIRRFLPVSDDLGKKAMTLMGEVPTTVIPNVVDTSVFRREDAGTHSDRFQFIHVSSMIYQKNPEGLLRVFKRFNEVHPQTFLKIVGPYPPEVFTYAQTLGLTKNEIEFTGPVSYAQVAKLFNESKALVLFSRYENLPCVILEALCCGIPVISTQVGGVAEVLDNTNGILVDNENEDALMNAFERIYLNYTLFNKKEMSLNAIARFSFVSIGGQVQNVYDHVKLEKQQ